MTRVRALAVLALAADVASSLPAQQPASAPAMNAITATRLRADLMCLASDAFRGRLIESRENLLAHEWVKSRLEWLGLKPTGPGGSFYAPFQLMPTALDANNDLTLDWGGTATTHPVGTDWHPRAFSGSGRASGPVVFAGFGIAAPEFKRDELGGDVRGKVVLLLDHEPGENDPNSAFDGLVTSEHANQGVRAPDAQDRSAVAVLFVADVHNPPTPEDFGAVTRANWPARLPRLDRYQLASWVQKVRIPVGQVSVALAEQLVRGTGRSLTMLARAAESGGAVVSLSGVAATLTASAMRTVVPDRNVVATIDHANASFGLAVKKVYDNNISQLLRRTDMWPFLQRGVPAVTFATGLHPDYHTSYDRPEKIDYVKLERIARLVFQASWDLAEVPSRPSLNNR